MKRAWRPPAVRTWRPLSAALIALLATDALAASPRSATVPRGCRDRSCVRGRSVSSGSSPLPFPFSDVITLAYPYVGSDRIPACTDDSTCVVVSGIGVLDGGLAWQWKGHDGGAIGTQTDPGTGTVINSFIWGQKALDITAASQAPNIVSTEIDALYGQVQSGTYFVGYPRATGRVNGNAWWEDGYPGGAVGYFQLVEDFTGATEGAPGMWCSAPGNAPGSPMSTYGVLDGWGMVACRYDGVNSCANNTHGTIDVGTLSTQSCSGLRRDMSAGTHYIEGASNARTDLINGPLLMVPRYNARPSDATWQAVLDKAMGVYNTSSRVEIAQNTTVQGAAIDNTLITGNVDVFWTIAPLATVNGLATFPSYINTWAANAIDISTAVDVGTPTVTPNVQKGPFDAMRGPTSKTCAAIYDDSNSAFEGKQSLESIQSGDGGYRNASFFLARGRDDGGAQVLDKATIIWVSNANTNKTVASCAITGIGTDAGRYTCTSKFTDGASVLSSIKAQVVVGTDAGDVGEIIACQGQVTEGIALEPPWTTNVRRPDTYLKFDPSTFSPALPDPSVGGCYEVIHTPSFSPNAASTLPPVGDAYYLFDAFQTGTSDHTIVIVPGYTCEGCLLNGFRSGTGTNTDILSTGVFYAPGHTYSEKSCWSPSAGGHALLYVYHDDCGTLPVMPANPTKAQVATWSAAVSTFRATCHAQHTLINSDLSGTGTLPGTPDMIFVGNRLTANVPSPVTLNQLTFMTLP